VPFHPDDYVHRIGRTGRAGRSGTAITIVAGTHDAKAVAAIEKLIGQTIPWMGEPPGAAVGAPQASASPRPSARPHRRPRGDDRRQAKRPAPVARFEEPRSRRAPQPGASRPEEGDASHLPAFLLRPVPVKA